MFITNIRTGITEDYRKIFPTTSFPSDGPSEIWLEKRGFRKARKDDKMLSVKIRETRNELLEKTDWIIISSYEKGHDPQIVYPEWVSYRQALRDITLQDGFPHSVVWPVKPE